jgi:outer membrane protein OmpA-like peptidoglycan-associated protein
MNLRQTVLFASVLAASSVCFAAGSERETLSVGKGAPSAEQVATFLFPEAECESTKYQCMAVRPSSERSIGMDIRFQTGSSELTPEARAQLENLGKVLASRNGKLSPGEIVIEGHTDARGSDDLNRKLSAQRAQSVVKHLVAVHGVDAKALKPLGKGKEDLKDTSHPDSQLNRRVELVRTATK